MWETRACWGRQNGWRLSLTLPEDLLQFKVCTPAGDGSLQRGMLQQQRVSNVFVNLQKTRTTMFCTMCTTSLDYHMKQYQHSILKNVGIPTKIGWLIPCLPSGSCNVFRERANARRCIIKPVLNYSFWYSQLSEIIWAYLFILTGSWTSKITQREYKWAAGGQ